MDIWKEKENKSESLFKNVFLVELATDRVQIQKEGISNLKCENLLLSKEIYDWSLYRDLQTGLKLDFTAHGIMESISEFGL